MHVAHYLGLVHRAQLDLAKAFEDVARGHADEADIAHLGATLAAECRAHADRLEPFVARYGEEAPEEPDRLYSDIFHGHRQGPLGLVRDLQDLYLMACECDISWTLVAQAAHGLRDQDLLQVVQACEQETAIQLKWLRTRLKQTAPQALVVA